jgi:hypothetical protein
LEKDGADQQDNRQKHDEGNDPRHGLVLLYALIAWAAFSEFSNDAIGRLAFQQARILTNCFRRPTSNLAAGQVAYDNEMTTRHPKFLGGAPIQTIMPARV